jgi:hypothetical protein
MIEATVMYGVVKAVAPRQAPPSWKGTVKFAARATLGKMKGWFNMCKEELSRYWSLEDTICLYAIGIHQSLGHRTVEANNMRTEDGTQIKST